MKRILLVLAILLVYTCPQAAQQILNNGESGLVIRTKINENTTEQYNATDGLATVTDEAIPVKSGTSFVDSPLSSDGTDITVAGDILPDANNTRSFGSDLLRWAEGWFFGTTLNIGDSTNNVALSNVGLTGIALYTGSASGQDDMTVSGTLSVAGSADFMVWPDASGTPDTFSWSVDGVTIATGVSMIGGDAPQLLENGVYVAFTSSTGHNPNKESWTFGAGYRLGIDKAVRLANTMSVDGEMYVAGKGNFYDAVGVNADVSINHGELVVNHDSDDTSPIATMINDGDNPGEVEFYTGDRDPDGLVDPGGETAVYYRSDGAANSGVYVNLGGGINDWDRRTAEWSSDGTTLITVDSGINVRIDNGLAVAESIDVGENIKTGRAISFPDDSTQSRGAIPDSFGCHLETAKYKQSLDVSAQDSNPNGISFKECGMKMFMVGRTTETLYGYDVSIAWNVTTATVVSSLVITAYDDDPSGIDFDHDGTDLYVAGNGTDSVLQYHMVDGYDIDNAVYLHSFDVSAQELTIRDVAVSKTGLKMWIVGVDSDTVYQYDIEVAGNVSTAAYNGVFFDLSAWDDAPHGLEFNGNETIMYISGNSSDTLIEFGLEMPGDVSTSVHQYSFSIVNIDNNPTELFLSDDGAHLYFCGSQYDSVYEFDTGLKLKGGLSFGSLVDPLEFNDGTTQTQAATPDAFGGHVETASHTYTLDVSGKDTNPVDVAFRPTGLQAYIMGEATDIIYEYALTVANELSTASYLRELDSPSMSGATRGMAFLKPGVKMYIVEASGDDIQEWDLSIPWNITTATKLQQFDISAQTSSPEDLALKPDGSRIFVVDSGNVFQYELDTHTDVSTSEYKYTLVISGDVAAATGISFRDDGLLMRISDVASIHEYSLYEAWEISTASHTQEISVATEDNAVTGVFVTQYGNKMFVSGSQNDSIYGYGLGLQIPGDLEVGGNIIIPTDGAISIGTAGALQVIHDGTDSVIYSQTGDLRLTNNAVDKNVSVELGTDTSATNFNIENNSEEVLFEVDGTGDVTLNGGDINFRVQTDAASQSIVYYQDIASGGAESFRIKYQDDSTPGGMLFAGDAVLTFENTNAKSFYFSTSGADTNAIMNIYNNGTNSGDLYLYAGDRNPLGNVTPFGVSLYARQDATDYGLYVGDGDATSWKELFSLETDGSASFLDDVNIDGLIGRSLSSTITASTTQTQGQQPLTKNVNNITIIANDNDVVTLPVPSATTSYQIVIYNSDASETLQIFPSTGVDLGAGVNISTTLAPGANVAFGNADATNWRTE